MVNVDLHNHLGRNGENPGFDETIDIAFGSLGPGGIFGICNDGPNDSRYENFIDQKGGTYLRVPLGREKKAIYVPDKDIIVVGVEEVEPNEGHFLAVGMPYGGKICKHKNSPTLEDALKAAYDFKTLRIVVHPFGRDGLCEAIDSNFHLLRRFQGFEVYNASAELAIPGLLPLNANKKAQKFYAELSRIDRSFLGACAFTDGHSTEVIGTSYTVIPPLDKKDFFESLKSAISSNREISNLHMAPAKWDAAKHAWNMVQYMAFGTAP